MDNLNWLTVIASIVFSSITANLVAYFWYIKYLQKVSEVNEIWLKDIKSLTIKSR